MKLATWNVNSIRAREERLLRWLGAHQPDVLCLQELKVTDDLFPMLAIRSLGYHAAVHGQKTYNGVAILTRSEPLEVERGFGDGGDDTHGAPRGGAGRGRPRGERLRAQRAGGRVRQVGLQDGVDEAAAGLARPPLREDRPRGPLRRLQRGPRGPRRLRPGRVGAEASSSTPRPAPRSRTCARGASWTPSACTTRRRASTRGGTTGCWRSRRAGACASTTCSSASRWPRSAPPRASTGTSGRASSPRTTPRSWSSSDVLAEQALQQLDLAGVVEVVGGDAAHQAADRLPSAGGGAVEVAVREPRDRRAELPMVVDERGRRLPATPPRSAASGSRTSCCLRERMSPASRR